MKKQLLFNFSNSFSRAKSFRMAAFAALTLLSVQSSFAQYAWVGGTSSEFSMLSNWDPAPVAFATADIFTIGVTGNNGNQVTNTAAVNCRQITLNSGVTFTANANITTSSAATTSVNGVLNVISGTSTLPKLYTGNTGVAGVSGVLNIENGATVTGNNVWRVGANASSPGTININGGTLTLGTAGSLSLGHSSNGTLNINSGTVNINYTTFSSLAISAKGLVNIDNGTMIIPGDQTNAVQAFITAGTLKAVAGKTISNTFDAGTNLTTVAAVSSLGVNEKATDVNSIVVYSQGQSIKVNSENTLIADVNVYDITGHLIESKKNIQSKETSLDLNTLNQIVVVKVTTSNGTILSRKIIQ
ncbi:T9SS sorting signal type C domain-containing protein [Flavobacterium eburneipallidum]|uniref:T9SS sorting signal type C domain-containing protein n=1 Tax=Flavobacterium eburneipallidum TaxID=3003263 RepID=UPI0022AC65C5|nr:T9SS sorting signal type C domain-containing protein [Flavobacterium eburneipallidum]